MGISKMKTIGLPKPQIGKCLLLAKELLHLGPCPPNTL